MKLDVNNRKENFVPSVQKFKVLFNSFNSEFEAYLIKFIQRCRFSKSDYQVDFQVYTLFTISSCVTLSHHRSGFELQQNCTHNFMDNSEVDGGSVRVYFIICFKSCVIWITEFSINYVSQFLLYEQDGVLLTTKGISGDNSNLHLGKLRIVKEVLLFYVNFTNFWLTDNVIVL